LYIIAGATLYHLI